MMSNWILPAAGAVLAAATSGNNFGSSTSRLSMGLQRVEANGASCAPRLSANGRFVVFESKATNLVPHDGNERTDIFVFDLESRSTRRVSVAFDGSGANGDCFQPTISADGRRVAFLSTATNLVHDDTNGCADVFVRDLTTQETFRASITHDGKQSNAPSGAPFLTPDGRTVVFQSAASNLVPGDTNGKSDIFVHNLAAAQTLRITMGFDGSEANGDSICPSASDHASVIVFSSNASNLVPQDGNGTMDVFAFERRTGKVSRISASSAGEGNGLSKTSGPGSRCISNDGRLIVFESGASNLLHGDSNGKIDVFVFDRQQGVLSRASVSTSGAQSDEDCSGAEISANGRSVVFQSASKMLAEGKSTSSADVFLRDLPTAQTARVSMGQEGGEPDFHCVRPTVGFNGSVVMFESQATNLVDNDNNAVSDIFARK